MQDLIKLYNNPLISKRTGTLYNAFPYPTKISPEAIAIYIACHTNIGDTILDPFSGSGTTGLATLLCANPSKEMITTGKKLGIKPVWGKRKAILYELSSLGAFVAEVMCNPPSSNQFNKIAKKFLYEAEIEFGNIYSIKDPEGNFGTLRYAIWSEVLICPICKHESTFWEIAVTHSPLKISSDFNCPSCNYKGRIVSLSRAKETVSDPLLKRNFIRKIRIPVWLYGRTGTKTWNRKVTESDLSQINSIPHNFSKGEVPLYPMEWGILYRKGYHTGITHLHHFYTDRNLIVFSRLWDKASLYPPDIRSALKLLLLSYNSSHSTLMSRVVVKKNSKDFIITGAQSGVLYISNLPVEKNILDGIKRKITTFTAAFKQVEKSKSIVQVFNHSSTNLRIQNESVDYVFTDPPFGDYIPYSEINQINEAWLGKLTNTKEEVIVNDSQRKGTNEYGFLMKLVFSEIHRVLKNDRNMSLVFHSAEAEIWHTLVSAYQESGFTVLLSNILDKVQGSFKQVTSNIKVQGDPLLLLVKSCGKNKIVSGNRYLNEDAVIKGILANAYCNTTNPEERKPERLFSRYVTSCLEIGIPVTKSAKYFYKIITEEIS